ncbi:Hypothetical protein D9617_5g067690 [Elsinoe fawcettii]|nr:Hypothetical protein D9617_5g067690 [Elsinoe fawcettii]
MPLLENIQYCEDETVQVITDFYDFMASMYFDEPHVKRPPASGWPMNEIPASFKVSDEVLSLLRRLPWSFLLG